MSAETPAPKPWLLVVDFYELEDFDFRVESLAAAQNLVESWCKTGVVGKKEIVPDRVFEEGKSEQAERHRVFPLSAVKQFIIEYIPLDSK